jgi:hypothetical protein
MSNIQFALWTAFVGIMSVFAMTGIIFWLEWL